MKNLKSLLLSGMFAFVMVAPTQAETSAVVLDCFEDAWDFGTRYGGGDRQSEYELTDAYYEEFC